jgi:hypothetical protein
VGCRFAGSSGSGVDGIRVVQGQIGRDALSSQAMTPTVKGGNFIAHPCPHVKDL